jgi:heat-inducible transcriptional repressor
METGNIGSWIYFLEIIYQKIKELNDETGMVNLSFHKLMAICIKYMNDNLENNISNNDNELNEAKLRLLSFIKNSYSNFLQQVNIIPLSDQKIVAIVCTDKGVVENKQFTLPNSIKINEVVKASEIINKMLIGTPISKVSERLEYEIKPIIAEKIEAYETIYSIFSKTFSDFQENSHKETIRVKGREYLLSEPEYSDVNKIKTILEKFEDKSLISKIDNEKESGVKIYIGNDSDFDKDVTVIKTTYHLNGTEGTIAIVGPKRMEYDRVVGLLSFINQELNEGDESGK